MRGGGGDGSGGGRVIATASRRAVASRAVLKAIEACKANGGHPRESATVKAALDALLAGGEEDGDGARADAHSHHILRFAYCRTPDLQVCARACVCVSSCICVRVCVCAFVLAHGRRAGRWGAAYLHRQRWFLANELELFKLRLERQTPEQLSAFMRTSHLQARARPGVHS